MLKCINILEIYFTVETVGREAVVRVSHWLRGIWEMRRRTSPVQQWVDSLPSPAKISPNKESINKQQSISIETEPISTTDECTKENVIEDKENSIGQSNMTISTSVPTYQSPLASQYGLSNVPK